MEKISFCPDGDEAVDFYVLEQTKVGGRVYILVTDSEEEDGEALIMKDISSESDQDSIYEIVTDEAEFDALADIFGKLLDDVDLER